MKLTELQQAKIIDKVKINATMRCVRIDVSMNKEIGADEKLFNIYGINEKNDIVWQVRENETHPIDDWDYFIYLGKNNDKIIADRFSGFEYEINPITGEAKQVGFHK